ncbi:MAG: response regulator [Pseudomonadales bacterium]|nr:response regulator [Pseudomonadales bacterium]
MQKKSLKHLWVLGSLIPVITSIFILFLCINFIFFDNIENQQKQNHLIQATQISKLVSEYESNRIPIEKLANIILENPEVNGLKIIDGDIIMNYGADFALTAEVLRQAEKSPTDSLRYYLQNHEHIFLLPLHAGQPGTAVPDDNTNKRFLAISYTMLPTLMLRYKTAFTTLLITLGILSMSIIYLFSLYKKAVAPLQLMSHEIQQFDENGQALSNDLKFFDEYQHLYLIIRDAINNILHSKIEMQDNIKQSNQDLRETLETIEIQNIELDLARKEAIKASKTKSEFLANTSHEIRTPLNGILGFTRLLSKTDLTKQQQDYVNTIHYSSENLLTIINDILDLSKIEAGKLVLENMPFNLETVVEETVTILSSSAHEKKLDLIYKIDPELPTTLIGDALRIKQILTTLVGDAIKFCEQGLVSLDIAIEKKYENHMRIIIAVSDTGPGFDQEKSSEIFNSFTQINTGNNRLHSGTGLGLAITKKLVDEMNGQIKVESKPESGSTFTCFINLKYTMAPEKEPATAPTFKKVLLFEENEKAAESISTILTAFGSSVKITQKFSEILPLIESGKDNNLLFEALYISIPHHADERIFGNLLIETLKQANRLKKIILHPTTFKAGNELIEHASFITKPLTKTKLQEYYSGSIACKDPLSTNNQSTAYCGKTLVVDDNKANLQLLSSLLEAMGCTVIASTSGYQAIELASKTGFDIIFMDIQMPGMDGIETATRIRNETAFHKDTPFIAVTAHAYDEQKRKILKSGFNDCLSKPVSEIQLQHTLNKWLKIDKNLKNDKVVDIALTLNRCNNNQTLAIQMLQGLIDEIPDSLEFIEKAINDGRTEAAIEKTHHIHGTCCYTGATQLQKFCALLETSLKNNKPEDIQKHLSNLLKEGNEVIHWATQNNIEQLILNYQ